MDVLSVLFSVLVIAAPCVLFVGLSTDALIKTGVSEQVIKAMAAKESGGPLAPPPDGYWSAATTTFSLVARTSPHASRSGDGTCRGGQQPTSGNTHRAEL